MFWKKNPLNNPKSQCITNWNLPNHFPQKQNIDPNWQKKKKKKKKTLPISKELLNHKIITILRITKIPAHTHLGIHASSNKQIPQRKWLRKHTRANSQDKQNIHAYFVSLKYKNPLCVAPRIPISNLTPDECKCLATLHRRCAVWHKLLPVGKFCKSKTAAFNHFSKILKKITKSCVLNQLFTNEGTKQTQITKTSFWTNFLNKWPQVLDNETNEIASHNLFFSFFVKKNIFLHPQFVSFQTFKTHETFCS